MATGHSCDVAAPPLLVWASWNHSVEQSLGTAGNETGQDIWRPRDRIGPVWISGGLQSLRDGLRGVWEQHIQRRSGAAADRRTAGGPRRFMSKAVWAPGSHTPILWEVRPRGWAGEECNGKTIRQVLTCQRPRGRWALGNGWEWQLLSWSKRNARFASKVTMGFGLGSSLC